MEMESFAAMILCSCNLISDRDVRACVKPCGAQADRARDVFRGLGRTPKCGRCVRNINWPPPPNEYMLLARNDFLRLPLLEGGSVNSGD
jgi:bacterioferritin-associated ferredoxin